MHGLSSNYPNAESYDNLGTRAKDSNGNDATYYKATDASSLKDIFNQIGDEIISSAQSPTEVGKGENPSQAGYITITDQLGDYMQVDDINTLVYANKLFTDAKVSETTENNKKIVTYTFKEDTKLNPLSFRYLSSLSFLPAYFPKTAWSFFRSIGLEI